MTGHPDLGAWPKVRIDLPVEYQRVYAEHMETNRSGGTLLNEAALRVEQWMHRQVARPPGPRILELGAGNLNHLQFEDPRAQYDVVEPLQEVFEQARRTSTRAVGYVGDYGDLVALSAQSPRNYDKVISVAVLEHLEDLPAVVAASGLALAPGGIFAAGIPSEGGHLWEWAWRASTARAFKRDFGLDYGRLMAWEHINTAKEIEAVVAALFETVRVRRFPGPTIDTSIYTAIFAKGPRIDFARALITSRS
jgi:SAM-dependent methyltransferase